MIIYLEGPDGSGKSTLADRIAELCKDRDYEFDRFAERIISTHPCRLDRIGPKQLFDELDYMAKDKAVYILDRGPISDNIYRIFDNYEPVSTLDKYVAKFQEYGNRIIIIYCRTREAEKRMLERGDDNPVALTRHKELTKAYDVIMSAVLVNSVNKYPFLKFDYSEENATENILKIVEEILKKEAQNG